ncbi:PEP-CTERM putative exosortase interaction domain-containing protein [Burkholderiales bacterium JOSHI_001]|nr:PEP-CTERM putative exosortase interaction domain-containing protein [Burkholderiales bacterium JOSHI_001]
MMKIKSLACATLLATLGSLASATVTQDNGAYTITYDETTPGFGALSLSVNDGVTASFQWNLNSSVAAVLVGDGSLSKTFALPSFSIVANPGWALSGPVTGFLGNLGFNELNGGTTSVSYSGNVGLVGGPASPVAGNLDRTVSSTLPGTYALGYYSGTLTTGAGPLPSLALSGASIALNLTGNGPASFASVLGQPQNELKISFQVAAVPEPDASAMLLAGLAALGLVARRRR